MTDSDELENILAEVSEAMKRDGGVGILLSAGSFDYFVAKEDELCARVAVAIGVGMQVLGALYLKMTSDGISGWLQPFQKYTNDENARKHLERILNKILSSRSTNPPSFVESQILGVSRTAAENAEHPASNEMGKEGFAEAVEKRVREFTLDRDSDKWNRPYNAHYYSAHEGGRLRVFDLYDDGSGSTSVGETVVDNWAPKGFSQRHDCNSYVHFNFGVVPISSPDKAMEWFAEVHSLAEVKKLGHVKTLGEMKEFQAGLVKQLIIERRVNQDRESHQFDLGAPESQNDIGRGEQEIPRRVATPRERQEMTREQDPSRPITKGMEEYLKVRAKMIDDVKKELGSIGEKDWSWLDFGTNWIPHDYQFDSPYVFDFLKKRKYATYHDAEMSGYVPRTKEIGLLDAEYVRRMGALRADEQMIVGLRKGKTNKGESLAANDASYGYKAVGLREFSVLSPSAVEKMRGDGSLQRCLDRGIVFEAQSGAYVELIEVYAHPDVAAHLKKLVAGDRAEIAAQWRRSTRKPPLVRRALSFIWRKG